MKSNRREVGQGLVELGIIMVLLLALTMGVVQFGHAFMVANMITHAARDGARLIGRTLWPERWWIAARYGRSVSRVEHLWGLVRRGEV